MHDEPWAFLEADLAGATPSPAWGRRLADPTRLLIRAAELANNDWSEVEAARELGRLATVDCLRAAHTAVLHALILNPFLDIRGIRIARILQATLDGDVRAHSA